ncbi:hypothetical protein V6N13_062181 [Hibiscus sabdariffa]
MFIGISFRSPKRGVALVLNLDIAMERSRAAGTVAVSGFLRAQTAVLAEGDALVLNVQSIASNSSLPLKNFQCSAAQTTHVSTAGPKPWPIIGNLNLLGTLPHQSLH